MTGPRDRLVTVEEDTGCSYCHEPIYEGQQAVKAGGRGWDIRYYHPGCRRKAMQQTWGKKAIPDEE